MYMCARIAVSVHIHIDIDIDIDICTYIYLCIQISRVSTIKYTLGVRPISQLLEICIVGK